MSLGIWNIGWLNANAGRAYPLREGCSRRSQSGSFVLPFDLLVDASLYVPFDESLDPGKYHVHSVVNFAQGLVLNLGYDGQLLGGCTITGSSHTRFRSYLIRGEDFLAVLTVDSLEGLVSQPAGYHQFETESASFEPTVVRPTAQGVTGIRVESGGESRLLRGTVILSPGRNFSLVPVPAENRVVFHALPLAEELASECGCADPAQLLPPVRSVNGVFPDDSGNIEIRGDDCLDVVPDDSMHVIQLKDLCSAPCCGCPELDRLKQDLELLASQVTTLANLIARL